jgi:hypothetical protein
VYKNENENENENEVGDRIIVKKCAEVFGNRME